MEWQQLVGDELYPRACKLYPELASKLTGMLLQLGEKECDDCLKNETSLKERLREAMLTLDKQGGVVGEAIQEERRVDPQDGKTRTLAQLKRACQGSYTLQEIDDHWNSMTRVDDTPAKVEVLPEEATPAKEATEENPPQESEDALPESSTADNAEEEKVQELIPGLHAWLEELQLSSKHHEGISKWAEETGAVTLEEVIEHKDALCKLLELRLIEKTRFTKKGEAALTAIREKGLTGGSKGSAAGTPEYLSFNNGISQMDSYKPAGDAKERQSQDPKLDDTWWFWQQVSLSKTDKNADYAGATAKVLSFNSMKSFWGFWNHLPQPSTLLEGKKFIRKNDDDRSVVEAFMIFRDGVKPEWEDPLNASGGHFQIQLRPDLGGGQIDEYWNNIVMLMVMNQIEPAGMITGVRLVDKLIVKGKKFDSAVIRIEVWFADFDQTEKVELLKHSLERCMSTRLNGTRAVSIPRIDVKSHSSKK